MSWYQHNDIAVKLRAALDDVVNGQALPVVFAGLDKGEAVVRVVYNGETCAFLPKKQAAKKEIVVMPVLEYGDEFDPTVEVEPVVVEEKPKATRKKKAETTREWIDDPATGEAAGVKIDSEVTVE